MRPDARGFVLIELMGALVVLGTLTVVVVAVQSKNIGKVRKAEVIGDLSSLSLKQHAHYGVIGHYASTTTAESIESTYPSGAAVSDPDNGAIAWDTTDDGFTLASASDGAYVRGGGDMHGFDALRFLPSQAQSYCGYATISGYGTQWMDPAEADAPPSATLADQVFPAGAEDLYARDWFYSWAICDVDKDGVYWTFTTASYGPGVASRTDATNTFREYE